MCRWHVRALVVGDPDDPVGIVCERDVLERVILTGLDPRETKVADVMSTPVVSLPAHSGAEEALAFMRRHGVHQVPIQGDEALIGVVSRTDLMAWALRNREYEITTLTSYVVSGR
jgi:CBS domain-containing protein